MKSFMETVEALRLVRGSLNAGGIYVANIVSANEGGDVTFLRDCAATALEVFIHAMDNRMLRCTVGNDVRDWKDALACFFEHWDGDNGMKD